MRYNILALIIGILLIVGCKAKSNDNAYKQVIKLTLITSKEGDSANLKQINKPSALLIFVDDLDYNKYEKLNLKQEYYKLNDFQAYFSMMIIPLLERKKIEVIVPKENEEKFQFTDKNEKKYLVDLTGIKEKQGLILFNGINQPVFWDGSDWGYLEEFIEEYYK